MKTRPVDEGRRKAVKLVLGGMVAVPFVDLATSSGASAAGDEMAKLDEGSAQAKALQYVHDATKANRTDKAGTAAAEQFCSNCALVRADSGDWRPCQLFPGKMVAANGWCSAWVPK